jgi:hemin uptake protein HemP
MNPVGTTSLITNNFESGTGYITIPVDVERDEYIRSCNLQNRVSIKTEDGGYLHRVPIDPMVMNFIEFPLSITDNGTQVIWVNIAPYNHPIIIGRAPNNNILSGLSENQFKIGRIFQNNFVELSGNPETGHLGLSISSETDSEIYLNVYSKQKQGKLNLRVQGDTLLSTDGDVIIEQNGSFTLKTTDADKLDTYSSFYEDETQHKFQNKKFIINKGTEPVTLGNQTKLIFDTLFDLLGQSRVATTYGLMPLLNATQIIALKDQTSKILSQISSTD